jgi:hypothetical protein
MALWPSSRPTVPNMGCEDGLRSAVRQVIDCGASLMALVAASAPHSADSVAAATEPSADPWPGQLLDLIDASDFVQAAVCALALAGWCDDAEWRMQEQALHDHTDHRHLLEFVGTYISEAATTCRELHSLLWAGGTGGTWARHDALTATSDMLASLSRLYANTWT